ncbi:31461_t:CDS:2, partial [Gigaspora margarita]
ASNEEISYNRLDENIHGKKNPLYTPKSEKEEVVNEESRKEIEAEKVAQEYKKGDKMEIVVDTHAASKLMTDEDGFVQVINKKNKKKNSNATIDKRELNIAKQYSSYLVKKATEYLRIKDNCSFNQMDQANWIKKKWTINRKKDIALREKNGNCPAYLGETQTIIHFTLDCKVSRIIWTEAYKYLKISINDKLPQSLDEIFSAANIEEPAK